MEANQKLVCKCHGVSGSCAQRVCFRQLRRIDTELMQKALKMRYLVSLSKINLCAFHIVH